MQLNTKTNTPLHSTPLHSTSLHSTPLHSTPLHYYINSIILTPSLHQSLHQFTIPLLLITPQQPLHFYSTIS